MLLSAHRAESIDYQQKLNCAAFLQGSQICLSSLSARDDPSKQPKKWSPTSPEKNRPRRTPLRAAQPPRAERSAGCGPRAGDACGVVNDARVGPSAQRVPCKEANEKMN